MKGKTNYQNPYTCNKCGEAVNLITGGNLREGEASTKCQSCGFDDYWAYGFFESSVKMESKAKTYTKCTCPI